MSELVVGISGVRGIVGDSLTPRVVINFAAAFGEYCGQGPIILGRDGRTSGKILASLVSSTLLSKGIDVIAIGLCPTPTIGLSVEQTKAAGGISVTASHNSVEWNGLKFFGNDGFFLDEASNRKLQQIAEKKNRTYAPWNRLGNYTQDPSFLETHIRRVAAIPYVDLSGLRRRRFKVAVDCVNGAGGVVVPKLLKEFGCDVIPLNCEPTGVFAHNPEPLPEHLTELCTLVIEKEADLGVAVDPDVDRLVLISEEGLPFGEENTIASCVKYVLGKEWARGTAELKVCVNLSTTRAIDVIASELGAIVIRTPVGELNVVKGMKRAEAIIGGEGSGGVILPAVHHRRDALAGIALTLQHLLEFGEKMSDLKKTLPSFHIHKTKLEIPSSLSDSILEKIKRLYEETNPNTDDGLKLDFTDYWIHLRKSNTEPVLRIISEAQTIEKAKAVAEEMIREIGDLQ